jgi:isoaspartyl peptidase/L-asparaginase-like protein (Ntn-hydrolase superfamily)
MQLIVHGGAGSSPDEPAARQAVLDDAAATGAGESTPLDAVVAAVSALEDSPRFNAGRGAAVQADGYARTDAGVMTGDRAVGAVCAMPGVGRAASVARAVLERTPHVLVSGVHAVDLAEALGIEVAVDLHTDATRARYADADPPDGDLATTLDWVNRQFGTAADDHDTVGAVAVADDGALAAATSTGGRWFALPGRVGDTPQVGAGFYASPVGGASATGFGEDIARVTLTRDAVRRIEAGEHPESAAAAAVAMLGEATGGDAGVILADRDGRVGSAFNTDLMQTADARA